MATSTSNYRLTKPSPEDFYDIEVQNENLEVIDGKLKELETGVDQVREGFEGHLGDYVRNAGFGVTGGTLSAYTLTLNPSPNSYADGQQFTILPHVDCGANPKLNINGLGALTILKQDGSAVEAGEIKANKPLALVRVGSSFFMRSGGAGKVSMPIFTGTGKLVYETADRGWYECYTSGNFSFDTGTSYKVPTFVDMFLVGAGGAGGSITNNGLPCCGGGGGYTKTFKKSTAAWKDGPEITYSGSAFTITIGAGIVNSSGGTTSVIANGTTYSAAGGQPGNGNTNGGAGGSGGGGAHGTYGSGTVGAGGSDGSNGGAGGNPAGSIPGGIGQGHTTKAFGEPDRPLYAGGGGGGSGGSGGAGGGGAGGNYESYTVAPPSNFGGGRGGCGQNNKENGYMSGGGSGIVIIRWGY